MTSEQCAIRQAAQQNLTHELVEALEVFVKQWNACGPNSNFGLYFADVRDVAVAALAKARGEQQ